MELDIFIPSLKLAFEYQGEQHFTSVVTMGGSDEIRVRDTVQTMQNSNKYQEKREACQLAGITLIEVPYWWDLSRESLQATIHEARPEVIPAGLFIYFFLPD